MEHLERLRRLQDQTGGFTAFICWTFQPGHTALADLPKRGAWEYLKTLAVSRLYLDNFANVQASWVTQGLKIGQMSLRFGANDMGSLMIEENVVAAAGTSFRARLRRNPPRDRRRRLRAPPAERVLRVAGRVTWRSRGTVPIFARKGRCPHYPCCRRENGTVPR